LKRSGGIRMSDAHPQSTWLVKALAGAAAACLTAAESRSFAAGQKMISRAPGPWRRTAEAALKVRFSVGSLCRTCACLGHNILGVPLLRRRPHFSQKYGESCSHYFCNILKYSYKNDVTKYTPEP